MDMLLFEGVQFEFSPVVFPGDASELRPQSLTGSHLRQHQGEPEEWMEFTARLCLSASEADASHIADVYFLRRLWQSHGRAADPYQPIKPGRTCKHCESEVNLTCQEIAAYLITFEKHEEWLTTSPKTR
ncbi:hypothetical protein AGIG_G9212 [Arapaima gigas]